MRIRLECESPLAVAQLAIVTNLLVCVAISIPCVPVTDVATDDAVFNHNHVFLRTINHIFHQCLRRSVIFAVSFRLKFSFASRLRPLPKSQCPWIGLSTIATVNAAQRSLSYRLLRSSICEAYLRTVRYLHFSSTSTRLLIVRQYSRVVASKTLPEGQQINHLSQRSEVAWSRW